MKKHLIIFLISNLMIFGKEISIDEMLNYVEKTSYQNKIYVSQQKRVKNREKYHKLGDFNGIKVSADSNYSKKEDSFQTNGRVAYGMFYVEGRENYNSGTEAVYGVEKSVKDLIYSKNKSELIKNGYNNKINKLNYSKNIDDEKIALINLYKMYRAGELEIELKKHGIEILKVEEKKKKKAYSLGAIAKIEIDVIEYGIKNRELEITALTSELKNMRKKFFYDYGIKLGKNGLKPITPPDVDIQKFIDNYGKKEVKILESKKSISEENLKYLKYDNRMPEISVGYEHSSRYNEDRVIAKFSKPLFDLNVDLEDEKENIREQEILLNQKILKNQGERLKIYNNYVKYKKDYEVSQNNSKLEFSKYEIKKLEYSLGKVDYLEVMESFDAYLNNELAHKIAKNNLNAYIYEIIVRGSYEENKL